MSVEDSERPLLEDGLIQNENGEQYSGDGSIDFQGKPVLKIKSGGWRACVFILGTECCERLAYLGIAFNLVNYLTGKIHEGNVSAARNIGIWQGTCMLTPLIGAVLADSYWGRFRTIAVFSTIYFIGLCTLTLSASIPAFKPTECVGLTCPSPTPAQIGILFLGLYLIALGNGGIKPCVSSFGADQFDDTDPRERIKKSSFFNWFYFITNIGAFVSSTFIVWVQENVGWSIGFGIPALCTGIGIVSFFFGSSLYRFQRPRGSPLTRICQVLVASLRKHTLEAPEDKNLLYETSDGHLSINEHRREHTEDLRYLDKAAVVSDEERTTGDFSNPWRLCTVTQVEELKILINMFPIWVTGIVVAAVIVGQMTMFIEQGMVMDRKVGSFTIPAASLTTIDIITVISCVPIYDRILVPIARKFTGKERGFSELQRIGIGLFIFILCSVSAAMVETRRLQLAKNVAVPLHISWQIPQYFLAGVAEVFTIIGQLEFFYNQSPNAMQSLCAALALLMSSLGSYLSSLILTIVTSVTTAGEKPGWIPDNLNEGRLDKFFWLMAGLGFFNFLVYVFCAIKYKQKKASCEFSKT